MPTFTQIFHEIDFAILLQMHTIFVEKYWGPTDFGNSSRIWNEMPADFCVLFSGLLGEQGPNCPICREICLVTRHGTFSVHTTADVSAREFSV